MADTAAMLADQVEVAIFQKIDFILYKDLRMLRLLKIFNLIVNRGCLVVLFITIILFFILQVVYLIEDAFMMNVLYQISLGYQRLSLEETQ